MNNLLDAQACGCRIEGPEAIQEPGRLYRVSKFVNISEPIGRVDAGRSTGFMGTGVYLLRTLEGARQMAVSPYHSAVGDKVWSCPAMKNPYNSADEILLRYQDFSKKLVIATLARVNRNNASYTSAILACEGLGSLYPRGKPIIPFSRALAFEAIDKTVDAIREVGNWYAMRETSQPINYYMRRNGFDGVLVDAKGRLDNTMHGSIYYAEDFRNLCAGGSAK